MSVELLRYMGDDLSIANAARVSYAKESDWLMLGSEDGAQWRSLRAADEGLINYLMKNRHGTPFEMVQLQFRVKCPIGVSREWMRHRVGSFNEVSTRYVEMAPEFYVPAPEAVRTQVGKPGHYEFIQMQHQRAEEAIYEMEECYGNCYEVYQDLIHRGVAKELARNVLPLGLMTQFIWSVNLRSLFNFLSLRTHETALLEIRTEAGEVERLAQTVAPAAMAAWNANGRVSP